jgi:hypothetical protein
MSTLARVVDVEKLEGYTLRVTFSDGLVRELDFERTLADGILATLRNPELFARVAVDTTTGTIAWPNGIDLDPDVLHGDQAPGSALAPVSLREYRLRPTG